MAKRSTDGAEAALSEAGPALPDLGDLAYHAQRYLLTDSIMSEILVVRDETDRELIFKIAAVRQRSRAQVNRQAIYNSVSWMEAVGRHPGIVTLHPIVHRGKALSPATPPTYVATLANTPGNPEFMVLDYLQGGTLSGFVRKRALPLKVALWLAHQLATTMAHLHSHGCVHRDLKPENILFALPPRETKTLQALQPVLIDFGVAAREGEEKFVCGSRLWMAPELQEADEQKLLPIDSSSDLYALGLIGCYMLSGLRPRRKAYDYQSYLDYQQEAFTRAEAALSEAPLAPIESREMLPAVLQRFQRLLTRTLLQQATDRPTAAAFATETAALLMTLGTSVNPAQSGGHPIGSARPPAAPAQPKPDAVTGTTRDPKGSHAQQETLNGQMGSVAKPFPARHQPPARRQPAWRSPLFIRILLGTLLLLALLALIPILLGGQSASRNGEGTSASETATAPVVVDKPTSEAAAIVAVATRTALSPTRLPALPQKTNQPQNTARQTTATQADQPVLPPTLVPLALVVDAGSAITAPATAATIPTLALAVQQEPERDPPTLALSPATPTLRPTFSPQPTLSPQPTRTATNRPTALPTQTATVVVPLQLRLLSPTADSASAAERVTFAWESVGAAPTVSQCYELVFWDPQNSADKRSPVGAGRESQHTVNLRALADGTEPLLRQWIRRPDGFAWGVRIVACATPRTILQDVGEERRYRYQP